MFSLELVNTARADVLISIESYSSQVISLNSAPETEPVTKY